MWILCLNFAKDLNYLCDMTYNGIERPDFTPDYITELKPDEVFVFGSNLRGAHGGGAAWVAYCKFGAVMGPSTSPALDAALPASGMKRLPLCSQMPTEWQTSACPSRSAIEIHHLIANK